MPKPVQTSVTIKAPVARVFDVVAHIENYQEAIPHLIEIEFLSEIKRGVGAKFRETRLMGKRKASSVLEVTEYIENETARFVSDAGGTIWDSVFSFNALNENETELSLHMDAQPYKFLAKLMTPMIMGFVGKAVMADMQAIKVFCETAVETRD